MDSIFIQNDLADRRERTIKEINDRIVKAELQGTELSKAVENIKRILAESSTATLPSTSFLSNDVMFLKTAKLLQQRYDESVASMRQATESLAKYNSQFKRTIGIDNINLESIDANKLQQLKIQFSHSESEIEKYILGKGELCAFSELAEAVRNQQSASNQITRLIESRERMLQERKNLEKDEVFRRFQRQWLDSEYSSSQMSYELSNRILEDGGMTALEAQKQMMKEFIKATDKSTARDIYRNIDNEKELAWTLYKKCRNNRDIDNFFTVLTLYRTLDSLKDKLNEYKARIQTIIHMQKRGRKPSSIFQDVDLPAFKQMFERLYFEYYGEKLCGNCPKRQVTLFFCSCLCSVTLKEGAVAEFWRLLTEQLGFTFVQTLKTFQNVFSEIKATMNDFRYATQKQQARYREYSALALLFGKEEMILALRESL